MDSHSADEPRAQSAVDENETTPLLIGDESASKPRRQSRTLSVVTIFILICVCLIALFAGFVLPHATQRYVQDALVLDLQKVKVLDVTKDGFNVNAVGNIYLDDNQTTISKTKSRLLNLVLSVLGPVHLKDNRATIYLNHEGLHRIAKTDFDDLTLRLSKNHMNPFDLTSTITLQDTAILGAFTAHVLDGSLDFIPITAHVETTLQRFVQIRKTVEKEFLYKLPKSATKIPAFNLTDVSVQDAPKAGLVGSARMTFDFQSPIDAAVPSVAMQVSIEGCDGVLLPLITARNLPIQLDSSVPTVEVIGSGQCQVIPAAAFEKCGAHAGAQSPIDTVVQGYLAGNKTRVFVGGAAAVGKSSWIQDILKDISIPIDIPGGQVDQLARDIELSDVKLNLPSFFGGGGKPKISGKIQGIIDIPRQVEVSLEVDGVHVLADLLYKRRRFATIETPGWAPAISKFPSKEELLVQVILQDAPVTITNQDVFSDVVSALLGGSILVDVVGNGDVKVNTSLGALEAHSLPIEAKDVTIGGFGFLSQVKPKIKDLGVIATSEQALELVAIAEVE